jgi:hypothetical protein
MARLINPGTGELLDRLSILSLKILHGKLATRDVTHFENERNVLLGKLRAGNSFERWIEEYCALGAVNAALWYAEDELRKHRAEWEGVAYVEVIHCAFKIQDLNDQRAVLIGAINQRTGEHYGEEKLSS